jgi:hypothetical protein
LSLINHNKIKNSMKKILFLLITAQMFSCDFSGKKSNNVDKTRVDDVDSIGDNIPVTYPNAYVNTAFGYSAPQLANLKLVPTQTLQSLFFIDAQTESKEDIIMVVPFTESLDEIAQQLQNKGMPYQRLEGGISFSIQQPGVANINGSYLESPYGGGGISCIRIITGDMAISNNTAGNLFNGLRFYPQKVSFGYRKALLITDIQRQQQSNKDDVWIGLLRDKF